jgi:hypothetical protein
MSEWLKEHAWKAKRRSHVETYRSTFSVAASTTLPRTTVSRCVPVSDGVRRGRHPVRAQSGAQFDVQPASRVSSTLVRSFVAREYVVFYRIAGEEVPIRRVICAGRKMHMRPPRPSAQLSDELLTRNLPGESFDIEPMLRPARNVPAYEITSFIDVEEARVDRAWESIGVKRPISNSHPRPKLARKCPFG